MDEDKLAFVDGRHTRRPALFGTTLKPTDRVWVHRRELDAWRIQAHAVERCSRTGSDRSVTIKISTLGNSIETGHRDRVGLTMAVTKTWEICSGDSFENDEQHVRSVGSVADRGFAGKIRLDRTMEGQRWVASPGGGIDQTTGLCRHYVGLSPLRELGVERDDRECAEDDDGRQQPTPGRFESRGLRRHPQGQTGDDHDHGETDRV